MIRRWLRSPIATVVLFALAAGLILYGGINGVAAAPRIQSQWFGAQVELNDIDVAICENGEQVHGDGSLFKNLTGGAVFEVGRAYEDVLTVKNMANELNNGTEGNRYKNDNGEDGERIIPEFVRVTVYKYWTVTNEKGIEVKDPNLDPSLIELNYVTDGGWSIDESSFTPERTVLYYSSILPVEEGKNESTPFVNKVKINNKVLDEYDKYKGANFHVEALVDAIQTHNGDAAMLSAWGNNSMITVGADADEQ